eukprot:gnl/MRDRNA2_/MRDRNA2_77408_c0_seq1.p1 gnl/MRDRNA2_/MRDRNA2_77408_c0~~gnl/MRDRNA2_/MRDRNA2_77408_c0_seq1.p1  ORF type:complete len:226 (+),score=38.99 gnl/MRDRNA2_/MRDRNA2_77408_c0_seq1:84-761(+)
MVSEFWQETARYVAVGSAGVALGLAISKLWNRPLLCGDRLEEARRMGEHADSARMRAEAITVGTPVPLKPLPITAVNHLSLEALDVDALCAFYTDVLGFKQITRPDFETDGYWLWFQGVGLHMAELAEEQRTRGGKFPDRKAWQQGHRRIREMRGWESMPFGDHLAFLTDNLPQCERELAVRGIPYKKVGPTAPGAIQLFFSDPEGNMIEIGDCAPPHDAKFCIK